MLAVLLAGLAGGVAAQPAAEPASVQILTADDLAQAGVSRFTDLFRLLDRWYAVSVEGFTFRASALGLATLGQNAWTVLVDGQPVDLSALGQQDFNALPLTLGAVERVEVYDRPVLVAGVLAPAGLIHIHTRRPAEGPSASASFAAGNEVGDPGPFRYTSFASPNIDRIGPTAEATAGFGGAGWHVRLHGRSDEHHASDERIRRRVFALYNQLKAPRVFLGAGGADAAARGRLGAHAAFGGFSRVQDLAFFEPAGREVPREHRLIHVSVRGDFFPEAALGVRYRLGYTSSELAPRPNRAGLIFDWHQHRFRGNYEVYAGRPATRLALGLSADRYLTRTAFDLADSLLFVPRAYARLQIARTRAALNVAAHVTRTEGTRGYGALATATLVPAEGQTLRLSGSVAREPFATGNSPWYWAAEGSDLIAGRNLAVAVVAEPTPATIATLDAAWRLRLSERVGLRVFGAFRRFTSLTLAEHRYRPDPVTTAFVTETIVQPFLAGQTGAAGGALDVALGPTLRQTLHVTHFSASGGGATFSQAWEKVPANRVSYTARYVPLDRLSLWARLTYTSSSAWLDFDEAVRLMPERYDAFLEPFWMLDLSVQKRFWAEHGRLHVSLRNFLDQPHRTHPVGAITNMVLDVRMQLRLGGR